jgi:hypothetical protein
MLKHLTTENVNKQKSDVTVLRTFKYSVQNKDETKNEGLRSLGDPSAATAAIQMMPAPNRLLARR